MKHTLPHRKPGHLLPVRDRYEVVADPALLQTILERLRDWTPAGPAAPVSLLPDAIELVSLCAGAPIREGADAILHAVAEIASVHDAHGRGHYLTEDDFEADRQLAAEMFDLYAALALPAPDERIPAHTETLGAVVDRIAAWCVLLHPSAAPEAADHPALTSIEGAQARAALEQLCASYTALVFAALAGARRLPTITTLTPTALTAITRLRRPG
ncbi:hypothetical protein [Nocardia thailandica]